MPQPVCKKHSITSLTPEFCPDHLVLGHYRSFPSSSSPPDPSMPQWMLQQQHTLGSHVCCVFHALGTPFRVECMTRHLSTPWHGCLYWYQELTTTGTWAALQPPYPLGNCYQIVPTRRSRGADFPPPGFDAGATIPCAKFDHFTRGLFGSPHHPAQTTISIKQQLNQNCSLAPKNLFFLNDNMFVLWVGGEVTLSASSWRV